MECRHLRPAALRAERRRECTPDDRLHETIKYRVINCKTWIASLLLTVTEPDSRLS